MWRKQANLSVQEEFTGKHLPPHLEDSLPPNLQDLFGRVRSGVKRSADIYINLCNLLERLTKRNEGIAAEYLRFSVALQSLSEISSDTYAVETNDVPLLNEGMNATAKHLTTSQSLLEDEAKAWDEGVLEDLKKQRDCLVGVRDMFDRRDRYDKDNIPQLERRIESSESKLVQLRGKPEGLVKPGEIEKVEDAIMRVSLFPFFVGWILRINMLTCFSCRTNSLSLHNTREAFSSRSVSGTSCIISSIRSIQLVVYIRTGRRRESSMQNCRLIVGGV